MATAAADKLVVLYARPAQIRLLMRALPRLYLKATRHRPLLIRVGLAALQKVHEAFLVRARGLTDGSGLKWKELSPVTIRRSPRRRKPYEILRVRDGLEQSLNPADPDGGHLTIPRRPLQVFRVQQNAVTVGTRRRWAWTHHRGVYGYRIHIPRRPLWPAPVRWPEAWWGFVARHARAGFIDLVIDFFRANP
jgi:hypothetical protein